jgi:hypothetical protein
MGTFNQGLWGQTLWGGTPGRPVDNIVADVQRLLADAGVFWSDSHVCDAVNDVQLQLAAITRHQLVSVDLVIPAGALLVDIPVTVYIPQTLRFNNEVYFPTTHARLEQHSRNWRSATTGRPSWFVLWDAEHFRPFPVANQEYTFQLTGVAWPQEVLVVNPTITADRTFKLAIANMAAGQLLRYTRPDLAEAYEAEALEALRRFKSTLGRQQSHNLKRVRPGTAFTAAQSGSIKLGSRY